MESDGILSLSLSLYLDKCESSESSESSENRFRLYTFKLIQSVGWSKSAFRVNELGRAQVPL